MNDKDTTKEDTAKEDTTKDMGVAPPEEAPERRMLNEAELKIANKNMERMQKDMQELLDEEKNMTFKIDFQIQHAANTQIKIVKHQHKQLMPFLEEQKMKMNITLDQINNGVVVKVPVEPEKEEDIDEEAEDNDSTPTEEAMVEDVPTDVPTAADNNKESE